LPSAHSPIAQLVTDYPIKSETVICHIRQANSGNVSLVNTHPFIRPMWGKNWTYAHNGQLADSQQKLATKYHQPVGETDSEQAFCWILDQLLHKFDGDKPSTEVLFHYIIELCKQIKTLGVFNLLLTDGDFLLVYCSNNLHWLTRRAPFGKASLIDAEMVINFDQETTDNDIVTVIATQPLTDDEKWQKMQAGEAILFCKGELVFQSKQDEKNI
jgi:glutamine amidotransferase